MANETHHILWWNLENLFDIQNSPSRPDWLQSRLNQELAGWTEEILERKIENLASVIAEYDQGNGPDILGVCEIENKQVLTLLMEEVGKRISRQYKVMHHDTKDNRGIDIAIAYDVDRYDDDGLIFTLEVMKRNATRDLFQINLTTKLGGNKLILIGNHWPARSAGQYESEPYRMMVGETLSYWIDRIFEEQGRNASIVAMGDFNDEPFNRSITDYLMTSNNRTKIQNARSINYLYNLMFPFLDGAYGTYVFNSNLMIIDQFMVSRNVMSKSTATAFDVDKVFVFALDRMVRGAYHTPIRFGRPSAGLNLEGFSDHLPIGMILKERIRN
ncbi:endonuclease/exonuclease/phosphatase family protein [Pararhodonellum marinum]|uniref:endonuclease/exonuclease/phosphatase family protein n=1 Tax=Pararhodonellum marinum TaxID=2755358 RepID=UPI00188ECC6A|nr:endonuclease/exonuclease/phosphatase family protein [Pararhodonellum marinum]